MFVCVRVCMCVCVCVCVFVCVCVRFERPKITVQERLQVPAALLDLLNDYDMVIAGGAVHRIYDENAFMDNSCDVDFFIFKGDHTVLSRALTILEGTEYKVCRSLTNNSVITAVGEYNTTRIQFILTEARTFGELLNKFDFNFCKAAFNGIHLYVACAAFVDWVTMTVHVQTAKARVIPNSRLVRAVVKGFKLPPKYRGQLKRFVGLPIPDKLRLASLYSYPVLNPLLPRCVMSQIFLKHHLQPLDDLNVDDRNAVIENLAPHTSCVYKTAYD